MRNKILAGAFLLIMFAVFIINIPTCITAIEPVVHKYVLGEEVQNIDSAKGGIKYIEETYDDQFASKYYFINFNGWFRKTIGNRTIGDVVKLDNGYLSYKYEKVDVEKPTQAAISLSEYLKSKNIDFMYVSVPFKINPRDSQLPTGVSDFSNLDQDNLLRLLEKNLVPTYDLREQLIEDYDDWYSAFFLTDHHWKPTTGFWAYTKIAEELHRRYGYNLNEQSLDLNNYDIKTYEDWFLGSAGKKTGEFYAGVDDIDIIVPKFDTSMSLEIPVHNIKREGTFADAVYDNVNLEKDYFNISCYSAYIGGDYPLCIQRSDNAANNKKILILKDSFTLVTQPYYSFMFTEVDVIDLRHFREETLKSYIDRTEPDIVIIQYSPAMIQTEGVDEAFEFGIK